MKWKGGKANLQIQYDTVVEFNIKFDTKSRYCADIDLRIECCKISLQIDDHTETLFLYGSVYRILLQCRDK